MVRIYSHVRMKRYNQAVKLFGVKVPSNLRIPTHVDLIGPPDPISNLRPIIFAKIKNESNLEKRYRRAREETQLWNEKFWKKHNSTFIEERNQFRENLKADGKTMITADEMSVFYKEFLDKNWKKHLNYNIAWYKRNIQLLFLELRVRISKLKFK